MNTTDRTDWLRIRHPAVWPYADSKLVVTTPENGNFCQGTIGGNDPVPVVTMVVEHVEEAHRITVANFSSFHTFTFSNGAILLGCSKDRSTRLSMITAEVEVIPAPRGDRFPFCEGVTSVQLKWDAGADVESELTALRDAAMDGAINVVIVPLPVLEIVRTLWSPGDHPFRTIRRINRHVDVCWASRFCL
jgi:hypothetical protein